MQRVRPTASRHDGGRRRWPPGSLGVAVALLALPVIAVTGAVAATRLSPTMHVWRDNARALHEMVAGHARFDAAAIDRALAVYAADAERIAGRLNTRNAEARDLQTRFVAFRTDARAAQADVAQRVRLAADLDRVFGDCRSCHDKYKD